MIQIMFWLSDIMIYSVSVHMIMNSVPTQVDADFAVDLLGELVRAYLAATNILYQVSPLATTTY